MPAASTSRRAFLTAALAAGMTLGSGCDSRRGRVLRSADTNPDSYPTVAAVQEMSRLLAKRSDGRLRIDVFSGGQLGGEKDTLEITVFGGLDMNRVNLAPLNSFAAETIVPTLPFLFRDKAHMRQAMDGAPGRQILRSLEPHGLIGLCFYDSGARSFYTAEQSIRTPEDMRGLKIRVMSSDLFVAMVEALGGDATPMAYGEVYQGLLQGVVDGAENNWAAYESSRHFEAAGNYSLTRHVMAPEVLVMSAKRWRKLPAEDRALVRQCAEDSVPAMRELWDERTAGAERRLRDQGITAVEVEREAFVDRVRPVWDRFLTTPALRQLATDVQAIGIERG